MTTKLLYVITDLKLGGVPLHLKRLALAMRQRGFNPVVVSLAPPGPVSATLRDAGFDVRDCGGRGGWDFQVVSRLARMIRDVQPDIVHSFLFHGNLAARRGARKAGFPRDRVICEIQTVEVERRWHLWVDRWTHRGCRFTIGNSPSVVDHLARHARIPRERLRLVRGGIDPRPYQDALPVDRASLGLPAGAPLVLWVGRLDPVKGLDVLIESFKQVAAKTEAHLLLAGDGALRDQLQRQIDRLALGGRVHLLGARSDVPALLKAANLFVFPSHTEGLPNALLEAMAAECPIVTTNVPGCRDLITHDSSGLLVPNGDTNALTASMQCLLGDEATARRLAAQASRRVTDQWHIEAMFDTYAAAYAEALA